MKCVKSTVLRNFWVNWIGICYLYETDLGWLCFCTDSYTATTPQPLAADFCSRNNFQTTFWISFIFGGIDVPDLYIIWLDFGLFSLWPWLWIFMFKYGICYISAKNSQIATKQKANLSIDFQAANVTIGFDLGHELDLEFSRSNMEFTISRSNMELTTS